ncbi:aldo/keto reductase [Limosilactobacillus gastricus]|uniref:aldo/keto reductase n=1 Tax=Limosilactobacillus gastricus TaxID=227942 RepID=UPI0026F1DA4A|nr:aldo/keto reductase [Limosilactobacillus gastricus]
MQNETYTLSNGLTIPKIAFGTWQISNEAAAKAVETAINVGYRLIDTAAQYENETGVGEGIKNSQVDREELFVVTKIAPDVKSYEEAVKAINESLDRLGLDYVDLMLIHAPKPWKELFHNSPKDYFEENLQVWKAMEEAYHAGKIRSLGVSNFTIPDMENIINHSEIKPVAEQIKTHIGNVDEEILTFCQKNGLQLMGYSPIATGQLIKDHRLVDMANKYQVTVPQLCIKYLVQRDILPLPKSTHKEFMEQNKQLDFTISAADMQTLIDFQDETTFVPND